MVSGRGAAAVGKDRGGPLCEGIALQPGVAPTVSGEWLTIVVQYQQPCCWKGRVFIDVDLYFVEMIEKWHAPK